MDIFTRTGDEGITSLWDGNRVHKDDLRIQVLGLLDELNSHLGMIKADAEQKEVGEIIHRIQRTLMKAMGQIAGAKEKPGFRWAEEVEELERQTRLQQGYYPDPKGFIVPGASRQGAAVDIARTVARRAETQLVALDRQLSIQPEIKQYINRISDFLYALGRYIDFRQIVQEKVQEVLGAKEQRSKEPVLTLDMAKILMERIEKKAKEMNLQAVIAICNPEGNPIGVHVMDGAFLVSFDIALHKAYTAVAVKMSTEELGKLCQPGKPLYGIENTNQGKIIIFGGGVPLKSGSHLIGGLGVSGGMVEQDTALADYGASIFEEVLKWK